MKGAAVVVFLLFASSAAGQSTFRLGARLDAASFTHSGRRPSGTRIGLGLALESEAGTGVGRVVVAYAPHSDSNPGWQSISAELVPYFIKSDVAAVGLRLVAGGQHVSRSDSSADTTGCQQDPILCFSDGPSGFDDGWAVVVGGAGELAIPLRTGLSLNAAVGMGYLVGGPNAESRVGLWAIGVGYTL